MNIKTIATGSWEVQKADLNLRFAALISNTPKTGETAKMVSKAMSEIVFPSSRNIVAGVLLMSACTLANAQCNKTYLTGVNRANTTIDMASSQYGDGIFDKNTVTAEATKTLVNNNSIQSKAVFMPNGISIFGDDKYLKNKEAGKRYTNFQVFDTKKMNKEEVMLGLLTNSLDRSVRYNEKNNVDTKITLPTSHVVLVDNNITNLTNSYAKVIMPSVSAKGKSFVILGENDYRYFDGKPLAGSEKLVAELSKGKPITEATFYYELKSVGIVNSATTLLQFTQMNIAQQQSLLKAGTIAADF